MLKQCDVQRCEGLPKGDTISTATGCFCLHSASSLFPSMSNISVKIEFGGGLELLFSNQRSHMLEVPSKVPRNNSTDHGNLKSSDLKDTDLTFLVLYLRDRLLKERPELFVENRTV